MAVARKRIKVGNTDVMDTEVIYAKAMGLQISGREIDSNLLMSHELSPVPTSMFDERGHMRLATAKSSLMNALKVESSIRQNEVPTDVIFLDGCAILWVIQWPNGTATVQDYIDKFRGYIHGQLLKAPVHLIFDR